MMHSHAIVGWDAIPASPCIAMLGWGIPAYVAGSTTQNNSVLSVKYHCRGAPT